MFMKKFYLAILMTAMVACGPNLKPQLDKLEKENKLLKEMAGPLPASLDKYFPPQSPKPVYLMEMFGLSNPFEGISLDLQEKDMAGAKANYDAFKAQYQKLSNMVDEWKDKFPMGPVDTLGQALAGGDPSKVGPAMGRVGQVCASCHILNQIKAHQKYHWGNFDEIKINDPLSQKQISWHDYMMQMAGTFSGIGNELQQKQLDNARKNFKAFNAMFEGLTEGCALCHDTPRAYFVDEKVKGMIAEIGKAIDANPPDGNTLQQLLGAVGQESCMKCHLVHMASFNTKARWQTFGELFKK